MSYRLIDANNLNGKISDEDYEIVLEAPHIFADLPNGFDREYYEIPGWIPVTERLPENNEEVWITDVEGKVERARFYKEPYPEDGEKDRFACRTYLVYAENVLAWQSILKPEPYKEIEDKE